MLSTTLPARDSKEGKPDESIGHTFSDFVNGFL